MSGLLLDTHIWIWYLTGSSRLPADIRHRMEEEIASCWLSPVSLWELGVLVERSRVKLQGTPRQWVQEAMRQLPLHEAVLTHEIALNSHELTLPHRDPADRLLASTALTYGLTLVTVDRALVEAEWLPTFSGDERP